MRRGVARAELRQTCQASRFNVTCVGDVADALDGAFQVVHGRSNGETHPLFRCHAKLFPWCTGNPRFFQQCIS